jgi:hypothetical protein
MFRRKIFDWYTFLTKKALKYNVFKYNKVFMAFWADGPISRGTSFCVHGLFGNSWDCPVTLDIQMKVTPKTFFCTTKQAEKLVVPRQWHVPLRPGEIVLVSAPGYACFDCKPCKLTFEKAKVSKEGKGKCAFRRSGKSLGFSVSPLGLLLLPLGFIVISWHYGASLELPIKKDKTKTQDDTANLQQKNLLINSIWSLAEPNTLDLSRLSTMLGPRNKVHSEAEIKRLCEQAYSKWCRKRRQNPELVIVTSQASVSQPDETERMDIVSAVPVNANWQE